MRTWLLTLVVVVLPAAAAHAAAWNLAEWHQWEGNGHYYSVQQITGPSTGWLIARSQAQALVPPGGATADLATLTTAAENNFVFQGIDSPTYWTIDAAGNNEGPNLGGFQTDKNAEPAGNWAWVTGEPWNFTAWSPPGEPNNSSGTEDFLTFFTVGGGRTAVWNDISSGTSPVGTQGAIHYYVAEAVPEPGAVSVVGALLLAGAGKRRRR